MRILEISWEKVDRNAEVNKSEYEMLSDLQIRILAERKRIGYVNDSISMDKVQVEVLKEVLRLADNRKPRRNPIVFYKNDYPFRDYIVEKKVADKVVNIFLGR